MAETKSDRSSFAREQDASRHADRFGCLVVSFVICFGLSACVSTGAAKQKLANASNCCEDLAGLPYSQIEFEKPISFDIDEKSPVFPFPTTRSYFRAFALPPADSNYFVILKSQLTHYETSVLMSQVFCPVVMLLDEKYQIRADYLRPLAFNAVEETPRSISLRVPLTPQDRFLVVHTEDVFMDKKIALDLGRDSPSMALPIGPTMLDIPKRPFADPDTDYRVGHAVPCVYTGKLNATLVKQ